ncbi:MAG: hypothetical protein AAF310_02600 [Myxococcota bacterium]
MTLGQKLEYRGLKKGLQEGLQQGREEVALGMLQEGMDLGVIRKLTHLPAERVAELRAKLGYNKVR